MRKQHYLNTFYNYFDILPARSPSLIRQAQHLRYQVYCVETGIKDVSSSVVSLECDEFDHQSVHTLIRHRASGLIVATVRLVINCCAQPYSLLPMEKNCNISSTYPRNELARLPRTSLAEVSRFAISKSMRSRIVQSLDAHPYRKSYLSTIKQDSGLNTEKKLLAHICTGLLAAVIRMSAENNITHLCAVMEPALLRLLNHFGICFKLLGPPVNYYGVRVPCAITVDEYLEGLRCKRPDVWKFVMDYAYKVNYPDIGIRHA